MARVISEITRDRPAPYGYSFDRIVIELARARLTVDGREVQAPTLPLRLLQALCERPGAMIPRRELFEYIWPRQIASNEALTKLIGRLRDMLGMYGARVVTVRGRGVRLDATVRRLDTPPPVEQEEPGELAAPGKPTNVEPRVVPIIERPIVLVVDDSPESVLLLTETPKDKYRTKIATSGTLAIKAALRQPQPDIILMDVVMPEMDGFELCKSLKQLPNFASTPIIFITGKIQPEEEAHGFSDRRGRLHHQADFTAGRARAHCHASQIGECAACVGGAQRASGRHGATAHAGAGESSGRHDRRDGGTCGNA